MCLRNIFRKKNEYDFNYAKKTMYLKDSRRESEIFLSFKIILKFLISTLIFLYSPFCIFQRLVYRHRHLQIHIRNVYNIHTIQTQKKLYPSVLRYAPVPVTIYIRNILFSKKRGKNDNCEKNQIRKREIFHISRFFPYIMWWYFVFSNEEGFFLYSARIYSYILLVYVQYI